MKRKRSAVHRPLIGISAGEGITDGPHGLPRLELKRAYADAISDAGGLPVVLPIPRDEALVESYLSLLEGLLISGGAFDIPPELYGSKPLPGLGQTEPRRTSFEFSLLHAALDRDLAVLGVCGGMQLMNVVCGGTLVQDIKRELPAATNHEMEGDRRLPAHEVSITKGTLLAAAAGPGALMVNSTHHQALKQIGAGLVVSAVASDGIVEAIEMPERRFALGVQWHPELLVKSVPINRSIYRAFVTAAASRQAKTEASSG